MGSIEFLRNIKGSPRICVAVMAVPFDPGGCTVARDDGLMYCCKRADFCFPLTVRGLCMASWGSLARAGEGRTVGICFGNVRLRDLCCTEGLAEGCRIEGCRLERYRTDVIRLIEGRRTEGCLIGLTRSLIKSIGRGKPFCELSWQICDPHRDLRHGEQCIR